MLYQTVDNEELGQDIGAHDPKSSGRNGFKKLVDRQHRIGEHQKIRFSFPIILAGTGLIVVLYPSLGSLKIPVVTYALVLIVMVLNSVFRYGRTSSVSFGSVFLGSIFFYVLRFCAGDQQVF